jgi:Fe-S-cluster-containing dehydrogenase component
MACELACSFRKEGIYSPALSRISVVQVHDNGINVPIACINCAAAPCIDACPTSSISRTGDLGIVRVDENKCDGCGVCVDECPYGAVHILHEKGILAMCDLCGGDPKCVPECIYGALRFERRPDALFSSLNILELGNSSQGRRQAVAGVIARLVRE